MNAHVQSSFADAQPVENLSDMLDSLETPISRARALLYAIDAVAMQDTNGDTQGAILTITAQAEELLVEAERKREIAWRALKN